MGERQIPAAAYYGIQTLRAIENFPISGIKPLPTYIDACVLIKKATALVNGELECIPTDISQVIVQATDEVLAASSAISLWWISIKPVPAPPTT